MGSALPLDKKNWRNELVALDENMSGFNHGFGPVAVGTIAMHLVEQLSAQRQLRIV